MKAPRVDYVRPRSLTEALDLLVNAGAKGRVIASGQSLVVMMNLRLASPGLLVDIARLPELLTVADDTDAVTLGACVTHAAIEDGRVADPSRGLMPRVAATPRLPSDPHSRHDRRQPRVVEPRGRVARGFRGTRRRGYPPQLERTALAQMLRVHHRDFRDAACRGRDHRKCARY
jgi:hypothetical protein